MTRPLSPEHVWRDICALYADEPLAGLCRQLQDEFEVDVALLLFLAAADRDGASLPDAALADFLAAAAAWRDEVVRPLRAVRQAMKGQFVAPEEIALRDGIKRLELEAERRHVVRLSGTWQPQSGRQARAAARYLERCGVPHDAVERLFDNLQRAAAAEPVAGTG